MKYVKYEDMKPDGWYFGWVAGTSRLGEKYAHVVVFQNLATAHAYDEDAVAILVYKSIHRNSNEYESSDFDEDPYESMWRMPSDRESVYQYELSKEELLLLQVASQV